MHGLLYGVEVRDGTLVSVESGVRLDVGVRDGVGVSVNVGVGEGVLVREGVVVGIEVGASPSTTNSPVTFNCSPTKIWTW